MYWYYKYPLIAVLVAALLGIGYLVWRSLPEKVTDGVAGAIENPLGANEKPPTEPPDAPPSVPAKPPKDPGGSAVPPKPPPAGTNRGPAQKLLTAAAQQYESQNLVSARTLAARAMQEEGVVEFDRDWFAAAELVSQVNTVIMNSEAPAPEKKAYTIRDGDALTRIAYRHNTTVGALQRLNESLSEAHATIYPGRVLYYVEGDWSIRVSRSRFVLLLYNGDSLYKMYRVGIGRQNRTPLGIFRVDNKVIHPDWNPPGKSIPYGDPENVLGTHWLGLEPVEGTEPTLRGYGIHGTWEPETVGTAASAGCVRMRNEDVDELFDFIPLPPQGGGGTRVVIED